MRASRVVLALSLALGAWVAGPPGSWACDGVADHRLKERAPGAARGSRDLIAIGDFDGDGSADKAFFLEKTGALALVACLDGGTRLSTILDLGGIGGARQLRDQDGPARHPSRILRHSGRPGMRRGETDGDRAGAAKPSNSSITRDRPSSCTGAAAPGQGSPVRNSRVSSPPDTAGRVPNRAFRHPSAAKPRQAEPECQGRRRRV